MIHILRAWQKAAHSQIIPVKSTGETELTDAALETISGGCGQSTCNTYDPCQSQGGSYQQEGYIPYYRHHHHYEHSGYGYNGYGNSSYQHCQPNYQQCQSY